MLINYRVFCFFFFLYEHSLKLPHGFLPLGELVKPAGKSLEILAVKTFEKNETSKTWSCSTAVQDAEILRQHIREDPKPWETQKHEPQRSAQAAKRSTGVQIVSLKQSWNTSRNHRQVTSWTLHNFLRLDQCVLIPGTGRKFEKIKLASPFASTSTEKTRSPVALHLAAACESFQAPHAAEASLRPLSPVNTPHLPAPGYSQAYFRNTFNN